jgi:membrane protein
MDLLDRVASRLRGWLTASRLRGRLTAPRLRGWFVPMLAGVTRARTFGLAAEMAFWLFLSLVPLAAVAGLVAARVATSREAFGGALLSSVAPEVREMIEGQVKTVAHWNGGTIAPVALGMFLWLAASGVHAIFDALEVQSETRRSWLKKRLLALVTCAGMSMGVAVLGLLAIGFGRIAALAGRAVPLSAVEASLAGDVARSACGLAVSLVMVAALYRIGIPRGARHRTPILPGAVLAVALLATLGWGYRIYVSHLGGAGDAYLGGLAIIGVTLTTLWLFSVAILLGAELNNVARDRRRVRSNADSRVRTRPMSRVSGTTSSTGRPQRQPS